MDTQMSPTPTPGLRPTPCVEAEEEGKAEVGGGGWVWRGARSRHGKASQQGCLKRLLSRTRTPFSYGNRTEKASDHRATDLIKALLHLSL